MGIILFQMAKLLGHKYSSCLDFKTEEMKLWVFILAWSIVKMLGRPERPDLRTTALRLSSGGDRGSHPQSWPLCPR